MSEFEFLFSLFGLVLGFTLVEVLSGLVRTTKVVRVRVGERSSHVGRLTPLLAIFVLLDVSSYWVNVWGWGSRIPIGFDTVFFGLLITSVYYYAASMVFPDESAAWPKLDEWFWLHRRQVLVPLFVLNAVWVWLDMTLGPPSARVLFEALVAQGLYFGLLGIAFLDRRQIVVQTALALLILIYLVFAGADLAARLI